ncbi:unnamed protein product [Diplocarpon coronariae]
MQPPTAYQPILTSGQHPDRPTASDESLEAAKGLRSKSPSKPLYGREERCIARLSGSAVCTAWEVYLLRSAKGVQTQLAYAPIAILGGRDWSTGTEREGVSCLTVAERLAICLPV